MAANNSFLLLFCKCECKLAVNRHQGIYDNGKVLPQVYRERVLDLHHQGFSQRQISQNMRVSVGYVNKVVQFYENNNSSLAAPRTTPMPSGTGIDLLKPSWGSIHCPGVAKLKNNPELSKLKALYDICKYLDWLLSTYNPDPPDNGTWIKPIVHSCQQHHKDIQNSDTDYIDLLNTVTTKRNDLSLHNHQHLQLQGWRANCDIQVVIDYRACVEYLKKYTSKGEPCSSVLKTAFNSFVRNCNNSSRPTKLIKKVIMKSLGQKDFSAQETMHHLLSLKLLDGSCKIKTNSARGNVGTDNSLLDVYAKRAMYVESIPDIMTLNFLNFVPKYKTANNKLTPQPENTESRVFPIYS
ncbi:hypothetical protein pdam_00024514 [Pocillopora damicornis]|uniref:Paired domain-containing protein n=1 Tax=Pocillopora damicornis TaxID=46731 RepID=A0A3M6T5J8_POCDA|nr:hypothetical protein pdam_00024514 [Pocillopora damicornis]